MAARRQVRRLRLGLLAASGAVACAIVVVPRAAAAKPKLAIDADAALAVQPSSLESGAGGALRLGYELNLLVLAITPEIGGDYHVFGGDKAPGATRAFLGGRVGLGSIIRPGVYAHVGYGHVAFGDGSYRSGATYDAGFFLDFTLLPVLDLGAHVAYSSITKSSTGPEDDWANLGLHAALSF